MTRITESERWVKATVLSSGANESGRSSWVNMAKARAMRRINLGPNHPTGGITTITWEDGSETSYGEPIEHFIPKSMQVPHT